MVGEDDEDRGVEDLEDEVPGIELSLECLGEDNFLSRESSESNSACVLVDITIWQSRAACGVFPGEEELFRRMKGQGYR